MDLTDNQITKVLKGCKLNKRAAQKELYRVYFGYAMAVAFRFSGDYDIAVEITNDAFLKIYSDLKNWVPGIDNTVVSFKVWLRNTVFKVCMKHTFRCGARGIIRNSDSGQVLLSREYKTAL